MEVILLERVEKLGQMGDVVNVKPGFARNYLLPQKKAVTATENNKKQFEARRAQLEVQNLQMKGEAEKIAVKLEGLFVTMIRQAGDAGQLYGSVNARDIAMGVTEAGFTLVRRQVNLDQPIKTIGLHPVRVALHPEVSVTVTANVARSAEEAEIQEKTGEAVIRTEEEEVEETVSPEALFDPGAAPADEEAEEGAQPVK
jgi:large subunit ribosomal protein L9